ncbi:MAG: hypothetical protein NUV67_04610 [archaeon]|nr:hypothetical protein [archaeon]
MGNSELGGYAFMGGAIIAILGGLATGFLPASIAGWIPLLLVVLGAIVGFMNITDKEVVTFLVAAVALLSLAGSAGGLALIDQVASPIGSILVGVVQNVAVFVAPAALIVGLKAIKQVAKD